jgi:hypothetical protein
MNEEQKSLKKNVYVSPKEFKSPNPSELPIPTLQFSQFSHVKKIDSSMEFMEQINKWFKK